jgi:hypothetical protein
MIPRPQITENKDPHLVCRNGRWSIELFNVSGVGLKDVAKMLAGKLPVKVTDLRLTNMAWKGASLEPLVTSPAFAQIEMLDLWGCKKIGDDLGALAKSEHAKNLRVLGLGGTELRDSELAAIRDSKTLALRELDISGNKLRDDGAKIVGKAKAFPTLRVLRAGGNEGYDAWTDMLAKAKHLSALEELDLEVRVSGDSAFGPSSEAWARFFACTTFPAMKKLWLVHNSNIEAAAIGALAKNKAFANVDEIDARGIGISVDEFEPLTRMKLTRLHVAKHHAKVKAMFGKGVVIVAE